MATLPRTHRVRTLKTKARSIAAQTLQCCFNNLTIQRLVSVRAAGSIRSELTNVNSCASPHKYRPLRTFSPSDAFPEKRASYCG